MDEQGTQPTDPAATSPRLRDSATFLLIGLGTTLQRRLEDDLEETGLTLRHLGALGHLAANEGMSITDLARRSRVSVQSMHATLGRLTDIGAVVADEPPRRGRASRLRVTDIGHSLLADAGRRAADLDQELFGAMRTTLRDAVLSGIQHIRATG